MAEVSITWNEETESWEIWSDPRLDLDLGAKGWGPTDDDEVLLLFRTLMLNEDGSEALIIGGTPYYSR